MERQSNTCVTAKRILVVEDEPLLRMSAVDHFIDAGYDVVEAATADEALLLLEKHEDFASVFTDVQMPGRLDGVDLATVVSARWPEIRIIVTSGAQAPARRPLPPHIIFMAKPYQLPAIVRLLAV
jgi:CheY-like chemotaxis protein